MSNLDLGLKDFFSSSMRKKPRIRHFFREFCWELRYAWHRAWRGYDDVDMFECFEMFRRRMIRIMEDFIKALGAEPVVYPYRNECCGGYISIKDKEASEKMCDRITESAAGFEADCLVTACPLCKYNLNKSGKLPIVYFTELLAEALGVKEDVQ